MGQSTIIRVIGQESDPSISLYDVATRSENTLEPTSDTLSQSDIGTTTRGANATTNISMNGATHAMDTTTLTELAQTGGDAQTYLDGIGFYGLKAVLQSYEIEGQTYVVAAAGRDNGISVLRHNTSKNQLEIAHDFGFADKLPVTGPTALEVVEVGGEQMILIGAFDTGSLTVLSLGAGGQLGFVDQVNDSLDTRFDGTAALATYSSGEVHLVAVGGNDGGLSLYQLLPDGRLVHRETLVDTLETGLASIQQLEFVHTPERIELVVLSARDQALTRFELDPDTLGITATGQDGGARGDVLTASDSGGVLNGNGGDDVIIDGIGADQFFGGAGEDIFIFNSDDTRDIVQDFNPNMDKIDLSSYVGVSSIDDVQLRSLSGGVRLFIDDEELRLISAGGSRITGDQLEDAILFASDHVIIPEALAQTGTNENEVFESGLHADTIDGGRDTLSFAAAPSAAIVDLSNNAGIAEGYVLSNIEGVTGSRYDDQLTGGALGNTLTGLAGNDSIYGGAGNDWLTPGAGRDTVDGGAGTDMVSFIDLTLGASIKLGEGTALSGGQTNTLLNIENVTGTIFGDFIQGNHGANLLRGLGDYDWIVGSGGADTIDGGNGVYPSRSVLWL